MSRRILQIAGRSSYDGTCIYALRLAENTAQYSFDFLFREKGNAAIEIQNSGLTVFHLAQKGEKHYWQLINAVRFFFRNEYDAIHYHSGGILILLIAWILRKKAIVIHHIHCGNITCSLYDNKIGVLNKSIYRYLNSRTYKIVAAEHIYEFYKKNIGDSGKLFKIENSVPFEFKKRNQRCNKIGYIGQIAGHKGFDEILTIFEDKIEFELLIKGDNYYKENLLHLNNCVTFIKPSLDVGDFFKEIDILLFPSNAPFEGMPLVVLESVINDTAVIAQKTRAVCEILGENYPLYVQTFSKEEVLKKIREYYTGVLNRLHLSEIHYKISQLHSFKEMKKEIESFYKQN